MPTVVVVTVTSITAEGALRGFALKEAVCFQTTPATGQLKLYSLNHTLGSHKVVTGTEHFNCSFTDLRACFESSTLHVLLRDACRGFYWLLPLVSVLGGACCHELHAVLIKLHTSLIKLQS